MYVSSVLSTDLFNKLSPLTKQCRSETENTSHSSQKYIILMLGRVCVRKYTKEETIRMQNEHRVMEEL